MALAGFLAEERWITMPHPYSAPLDDVIPVRPMVGGEEGSEADPTLGPLLGVIADDVHHIAAAARAGVTADFALRVAHARKYMRGPQLAAALHGIAEARKAALAIIGRDAAAELAARKRIAIEAHTNPRRRAASFDRHPAIPTMSQH
jgi:hypothetical protein